ncbi:hypothetical protein L210DRAFT_3645192 [Boletus edulis BED1]|uniref:Fatty acid synthase beta subunit AflB /Fas1-like central domain-containing protein n=1 Tax=Boletus edulis BED1 TaxID=1328754 RepID=A0AAD4GEV7_BOLED|nr:hypothetical protein L210DRAFT_3645192 [Boletus edulis BED1]
MPFDDSLVFTGRVMVAEAHTGSSIQDLIVAAADVDDKEWETTYIKPTGGVLTIHSELGEHIHKIAPHAIKLWKEFDNTVFNLLKKKHATCCWIDLSLRNLTGDWLRCVEEHFAGVDGRPKLSNLQSFTEPDRSSAFIDVFLMKYSDITHQLLAAEDHAYFLTISQCPRQKPVPFIPIFDANCKAQPKKDGPRRTLKLLCSTKIPNVCTFCKALLQIFSSEG